MTGFINLLKPEGMSSAFAVGAVKRKFNLPCGHMGTLDPMASGVLPVGIGQASRLFQYLLDKEKTYVAEFKFGYSTDTLDVTGQVVDTTDIVPTAEQIKSVLNNFIGNIKQVPPKYSAKCIDGKRGYQLARRGVDFTLEAKTVSVLDISLLGETGKNTYKFKIDCRGGTYIRSLARDIADAVGSLGVMSKLERTASGVFNIENGVSVEDFKNTDNPEKFIIPADMVVSFEKLVLSDERATKILNGVFENHGYKDGIYRVYNQDKFWGIGTAIDGVLKINTYVR